MCGNLACITHFPFVRVRWPVRPRIPTQKCPFLGPFATTARAVPVGFDVSCVCVGLWRLWVCVGTCTIIHI